MSRKKIEQINLSLTINGTTYVDISTPKFRNAIMVCDHDDFNDWANDDRCGKILAVQSTTSSYPYAYMVFNKDKRKFFHRYVMKHLVLDKDQVDHINHNGLDNRKANLRDGGNGVNSWNRRIGSTNKSGYKGVSFKTANNKWCAQITLDKRVKHLGLFHTAKDASDRYELANYRRDSGLCYEEL